MDNTKTYRAISKTVEAHELTVRTTIMTKDGPVIGEVGDFVIATPHEEGSEFVFNPETKQNEPKIVEVYEVVKRADFLSQYDVQDTEFDHNAKRPVNIEFPGGEDTLTNPEPSPKTVDANSPEAVDEPEEPEEPEEAGKPKKTRRK